MLLDHPSDGLTAIRTHIAAIFMSLELSRSNWLVTSLSPGKGEKMSKHSVAAGDTAELLALFAELKSLPKTERSHCVSQRIQNRTSYPLSAWGDHHW